MVRFTVVLLMALACTAAAQAPSGPCAAPGHDGFDFRVGTWKVRAGDGGETWQKLFDGLYTRMDTE